MWHQFESISFVASFALLASLKASTSKGTCRTISSLITTGYALAVQFSNIGFCATMSSFVLASYAYETACWEMDMAHKVHHYVSLFVGLCVISLQDLSSNVEIALCAIPQIVHLTNVFSELRKHDKSWTSTYKVCYVVTKISCMMLFANRLHSLGWHTLSPGVRFISTITVVLFGVQLFFCWKIVNGALTARNRRRFAASKDRVKAVVSDAGGVRVVCCAGCDCSNH